MRNAVSYLHTNQQCSRVAGYFHILQKTDKPSVVEVYNIIYSFPQRSVINSTGGSMTGNLFTYKSVFDRVGLFNDDLRSYGDLEWGSRAQKAGFKIEYVEDVVVFHPARSFKELVQKEKRLGGGVAMVYKSKRSKLVRLLRFLYNVRPSLTAIKTVRSKADKLRLKDMVIIPCMRYYFRVIRSFEILRVQLGKEPERT
jgi:GT2 family glycosyltransferase